MESVDFFDKWLDPPDEPEDAWADCDDCGETFPAGDLIPCGRGRKVCGDCYAKNEED